MESIELDQRKEPTLEELKEKLHLLDLNIGVTKRQIDTIQNYIKAGVFVGGLPSKEESEHSIKSLKFIFRNQTEQKSQLEERINRLEKFRK